MNYDLLTSLRKYRPRENTDPLENFITESFAWILNNYPDFGCFFLKKIADRLPRAEEVLFGAQNPKWETQKNFDGKYPDMFCAYDGHNYIFEHKAWSRLHGNQLNNYRKYAEDNFAERYSLILITGAAYLHDQNPDLALCWYDIYNWIDTWVKDAQKPVGIEFLFMLESFNHLLKKEGMGPPATISHEAIVSYFPARGFKNKIKDLLGRADKMIAWENLIPEEHYQLKIPGKKGKNGEEWGRIGRQLLKGGWDPGIFVGFMLNGSDHKVKPLVSNSPDCSIIIDIDYKRSYDKSYVDYESYQKMVKDLEEAFRDSMWDFHNHQEEHENPNLWHPIHIRIPMVELFRGTRSSAEQDECYRKAVSEALILIKGCESFWNLRSDLLEIKKEFAGK